ncbi:MAG: Type III restriction-modification system StyLTI enzyme mod [Parcubacteria group bacterium GW2011_GWE2_37_8]|nr:MAG: Type III restriction-modification system StyLTI enzyme mod [Parcubacteria group bacterium GW2011_GWE2_37_8]
MPKTRTPEDNQIAQLDNEVARLNKKIAKYEAIELKQNKFGLVWLDVPEAFEDDAENKLPILEEVPKLAINSKDGKPTHLLIEGDNYHALTCLNYTHKGKVDVIYIDPPYNTGSDGFKYKDKRYLKEYPDGTEVPIEHPLRHSYWLSFMRKRIELAKELLAPQGVLFISIDDNEMAQLKLLCDEVFNEKNTDIVIWKKIDPKYDKNTNAKITKRTKRIHEFILVAYKDKDSTTFEKIRKIPNWLNKYTNPDNDPRGAYKQGIISFEEGHDNEDKKSEYYYTILTPSGRKITRQFFVKKDEFKNLLDDNRIYFPKNGAGIPALKIFENEEKDFYFETILEGLGSLNYGKKELADIFGVSEDDVPFSTPKPTKLIKEMIRSSAGNDAIVLDFFAGSGTTGHAVMDLNREDTGNRQFILVTNNDEIVNGQEHKIMTDICYPRIKKVIKGYNGNMGLGNSVKYFRTAFVGKNNILRADDADKIELAHNAGGMLAIAENTLDQLEENDHWQIFEGDKRNTAVYFKEEFGEFDDFIERVRKLKKPTSVYIFSWEKELDFNEFEDDKNITVKTIPQPILEIYKQIYNLV